MFIMSKNYYQLMEEIECILMMLAENQNSRRRLEYESKYLHILFKEKVKIAASVKAEMNDEHSEN